MEKTNAVFLDPEKTVFSVSENGFLFMESDGVKRLVTPYLAFPLEFVDKYVSLFDEEKNEIGMIEDITKMPPEQKKALEEQIKRRYYCPKIEKIISIEGKMGVSVWKVCDENKNELTLTVRDPYKSVIRVTDRRFFVVDADGARYEIGDVEAMDKKSFSKLEIYL